MKVLSIGFNNQCVTFDRMQGTQFFIALKMSDFVSKKRVFAGSITFFFNLKKSAAESLRLLVEAYGEHAFI